MVHRLVTKARLARLPLTEATDPLAVQSRGTHAVVLTAERGSLLTLLHPRFSVAVPHPLEIRLPLAYPVARHDVEAARFLSTWIELEVAKKRNPHKGRRHPRTWRAASSRSAMRRRTR